MNAVDKYRDRGPRLSLGVEHWWDAEETITSVYHKQGREEVQISVVHKGTQSFALIRNRKVISGTPITSRWIAMNMAQIANVLDGLDLADIKCSAMAGKPEERLPKFPVTCGKVNEIGVKVDRFNGYFSVKICRKGGRHWVCIRPDDIEETMTGLVTAYEHLEALHRQAKLLLGPLK